MTEGRAAFIVQAYTDRALARRLQLPKEDTDPGTGTWADIMRMVRASCRHTVEGEGSWNEAVQRVHREGNARGFTGKVMPRAEPWGLIKKKKKNDVL